MRPAGRLNWRPPKPSKNQRKTGALRRPVGYCLEAVQRPVHPSDRTKEPEPLRDEKRPVLVQLKPWTDPPVLVAPLGLTDPELNSPEILPPEMTNLSVLLPQGVPTATATHEPSKPPPPPEPSLPLFRDARRGSSESGLAGRAGLEGSAERGFSREPDSDFSSSPMLPPALPDCASAALLSPNGIRSESKHILIERWAEHSIMTCSNIPDRGDPPRYCFAAVHLPVQPSDCRNVPPPLRPDRRPVVMTVMPLPVEVPYTRPSGLTVPRAV